MELPTDKKGLAELFRRLGANDPEDWAHSQVSEGIEQLYRYLFLRQAWASIVDDNDRDWIDSEIANAKKQPDQPYSGVGLALERVLETGASRQDLTEIVRGMQASFLFSIAYLLDDPGFEEDELRDLGWCLVATDGDFNPTDTVIGGLHESVLETDPTGREMRPRET